MLDCLNGLRWVLKMGLNEIPYGKEILLINALLLNEKP